MRAPLGRDEIAALACARWGQPNAKLSTRDELRFGNHGSLAVRLSDGAWYDHQVGAGGYLRADGAAAPIGPISSRQAPTPRAIWDAATPLTRGSPAWIYWTERRCCCVYPRIDLRQHPGLYYTPERREVPGIVAAVRDARDALVAVHRTFLTPQGDKLERMGWGPVGGGHVLVHDPGPHAEPGHFLIGEGLESSASAAAERPWCIAWSALSAPGMRTVALPEGVVHLTIAPDMDDAGTGQRAAGVLMARARAAGIAVQVIAPDEPHGDFNDQHRASVQEPPL
jgi:hypothetical protein